MLYMGYTDTVDFSIDLKSSNLKIAEQCDTVGSITTEREGIEAFSNEMKLYTYLNECLTVENLEHRAAAEPYGVYGYSYAYLQTNRDAGDTIGPIVKEFKQIYNSEQFYLYDLSVQHAIKSDVPVFMSQIADLVKQADFHNVLFERNLELYKLMQRFGYNDYWNNAFKSRNSGGRALVAFGTMNITPAEFRALTKKYFNQLIALSHAIDAVGTEKFPQHFNQIRESGKTIVHQKPLALLQTLATHKCSLPEAARLRGISISTANQQIAAAKQALDATTTHGAILKAIQLGLINI